MTSSTLICFRLKKHLFSGVLALCSYYKIKVLEDLHHVSKHLSTHTCTFNKSNIAGSNRVGVKMCTRFLWARGLLRDHVARPA